ncbi:hypothetical protein DV736_g5814, partial [Chaetothyriales sp. CBS 134916]
MPVKAIPSKISKRLLDLQATTEEVRREATIVQVASGNDGVSNANNITDADLYFHFLNHTCKYAPAWDKDRIVLQVGIAKLALDSEPVSHSVLALSAACLCCDAIASGNADLEVEKVFVAPDSLLAQAPAWLRSFALRRPRPTTTHTHTHTYWREQLVRSCLTFFSDAPKTYIDLLLPLLDPRTDKVEEDDDERELTAAEVLALDVYGHWLVLVFLVGKEAWWVGNFPYVALEGLISRYGDKVLGTTASIQHQWWPADMLEIATRLRRRK